MAWNLSIYLDRYVACDSISTVNRDTRAYLSLSGAGRYSARRGCHRRAATPRAQNHEAAAIRSNRKMPNPIGRRITACRRAIAGIPSRSALNDRVVRRRYQFIDQSRRRFAIPKGGGFTAAMGTSASTKAARRSCVGPLDRMQRVQSSPRSPRTAVLDLARHV